MIMKRNIFILMLLTAFTAISFSQEIRRQELRLPETILGYQVLKCDFHTHTVFSDGTVWPTVRIDEAVAEGLDAIAITDHAEVESRMSKIGIDNLSKNHAFQLAKDVADQSGIILIPGVEITKEVPPGHFNAIFIKDADPFTLTANPANKRDGAYIREALQEAQNQGAFIFWNHPWYQVKNNESIWFPIIDSLYNEGYFQGVEVINATKYDPVILGWAQSKNLTILSNTDIHRPMSLWEGEYRTMTIVFAEKRSAKAIHEALLDRRSIAYCQNHLYGDKKFLEPIFHASIDIEISFDKKKSGYLILRNRSSIPFSIKFDEQSDLLFKTYSGGVTIPRQGDTAVRFELLNEKAQQPIKIPVFVNNLEVAPNSALQTQLTLDIF